MHITIVTRLIVNRLTYKGAGAMNSHNVRTRDRVNIGAIRGRSYRLTMMFFTTSFHLHSKYSVRSTLAFTTYECTRKVRFTRSHISRFLSSIFH